MNLGKRKKQIMFWAALILFALLLLPRFGWTAGTIELDLKTATQQAAAHSPRLKAVTAEVESAEHRSESQFALLLPKFSVDASFRYLTEIPNLPLPTGPQLPFGDNEGYSVGGVLSWTALDFGATRKGFKSAQAQHQAKQSERKATAEQIELSTRVSYFRVQLAMEQLRLVADSLRLAQAQHKDIQNRMRAGSSSRADTLSSHKEVLSFRLQFEQLQAELGAALRELLVLTGENQNLDLSRTLPKSLSERLEKEPLDGVEAATMVVTLDPISKSLKEFAELRKSSSEFDPALHAQARVMEYNSQSLQLAADSAGANHLPKLQVSFRTSLDYPNGPELENIYQNTFIAGLSFPLFDGGRISREAAEKRSLAEAAAKRQQQVSEELMRDWRKTRDQLEALYTMREISEKSVQETQELAQLMYTGYQVGRSSFLEVQSANLRALEAKVHATRTDIQILIQLATLASLKHDQ